MGDVQGLCGANCRHSIGPGDGENNPYEGFDGEENRKRYDLEQRQRQLERRIRNTKREVQGLKAAVDAADPETRPALEEKYQKKARLLQKQNQAYNQFCAENDLKPLQDRLKIAGRDRKQAASATTITRKNLANPLKPATIGPGSKSGEAADVHFVTKLDIEKYSCVTEGITTDEVIITDERMAHIEDHHPGDYEQFSPYLPEIIVDPDYIIRDDRQNTAIVLKEVFDLKNQKYVRVALRLATISDNPEYKNSILTLMKIRKQEYNRLVKNKEVLYKRG